MTKSTKRKIIFALMAIILLAICTSAVVTIVRFLKEPASASIVAPSAGFGAEYPVEMTVACNIDI